LHSTDHLSVVVTEPRASDYIFRNVAFGPNTTAVNDIIVLGSRTITSAADLPTRITFERVLVLGHPSSGTRRGFAGHARHLVVKNSAVYDMKLVGTDAQAFWAANTPGPISLINNYFEAAGEVVLFGGAAVGITGVVPSDILVERNTITRPVAWRTVTPAWTVKNLLELKNARRVTVRNNEFSHNWAQAQVGWGVVLQPRPQDGVTWYVVEDVVFERNVFRSMGGVFNMSGEDPAHPEDGNRLRRITIRNNLALDISTTNWGGTGRFAQMIGYPETAPPLDGSGPLNGPVDVTIEDNIIEHQYQAVFFSGQKGSGLRFSRNLLRRNSGVFVGGGTASGIPTLNRYQNVAGVTAWTVVDNAIYGGSTDTPPGNTNYSLAEWDAALATARAAWGAP
jgi:Right handed beta helix region